MQFKQWKVIILHLTPKIKFFSIERILNRVQVLGACWWRMRNSWKEEYLSWKISCNWSNKVTEYWNRDFSPDGVSGHTSNRTPLDRCTAIWIILKWNQTLCMYIIHCISAYTFNSHTLVTFQYNDFGTYLIYPLCDYLKPRFLTVCSIGFVWLTFWNF